MKPQEIKAHLNKPVRYKNPSMYIDGEYILTGAIFRKSEAGFYYQAELADVKNSRSLIICNLEEIQLTEESK